MPLAGTYDVALLGTGAAPLVAASHLMAQGKSVLLLNPDRDFFLEDSELPLDPIWPVSPDKDAASLNVKRTPGRLKRSSPERVLEELRPDFPGAIELWSGAPPGPGFHDQEAPHVRSRSRLWITSNETDRDWPWELIEALYVEASDAGLKPQILEGLQATARFPGSGAAQLSEGCRGLLIPKICDVDVVRYRNGLLEFVRERLGPECVICNASQVELMPGGVRFHAGGAPRTARLSEGMLVFWTPRLSPWVFAQARRLEVAPEAPVGVRLWEQWSIVSREGLDPGVIGVYRDMAVWADVEGLPQPESRRIDRLAVLRAGALVPMDRVNSPEGGRSWGSAQSFEALSELCNRFLRWDRFSVRSMRARAIFEWERRELWRLSREDDHHVLVVPACDGPLSEVARNARAACERLGARPGIRTAAAPAEAAPGPRKDTE
jgi:hypothetical protein